MPGMLAMNGQVKNAYLQKLVPVLCNRCRKQHLHIIVGNAVKQHFLDIPVGLDKILVTALTILKSSGKESVTNHCSNYGYTHLILFQEVPPKQVLKKKKEILNIMTIHLFYAQRFIMFTFFNPRFNIRGTCRVVLN